MTTPTHTHTHHTNTYRINQSDPATQNEGEDRKVARFKNEKGGLGDGHYYFELRGG